MERNAGFSLLFLIVITIIAVNCYLNTGHSTGRFSLSTDDDSMYRAPQVPERDQRGFVACLKQEMTYLSSTARSNKVSVMRSRDSCKESYNSIASQIAPALLAANRLPAHIN